MPGAAIIGGLAAAAAVAGAYMVYKAYKSSSTSQAQEAAKEEGLQDAGAPQVVSE